MIMGRRMFLKGVVFSIIGVVSGVPVPGAHKKLVLSAEGEKALTGAYALDLNNNCGWRVGASIDLAKAHGRNLEEELIKYLSEEGRRW